MKFPLQSLYGLYRNAIRNPRYRWWMILGTLVYLLSPLDISPDVLPIVGEIDDFVLVTMLMTEVSQLVIEKLKSRSSPVSVTEASNSPAETTIEVKAVSLD
ncbi:MAG: YkvA family protein [Snowella sp.]|nr:YkvA family protein [Snowella sp.]